MPAHSLTLAGMGTFVLWFGWFAFNGCSTIVADSDTMVTASNVFLSSNIAAAASTVTVLFITWIKYKKPSVSMMLNAPLAGLVAITAGCDQIEPWGAFCIGVIVSFVMVFGIELVDKVFIDHGYRPVEEVSKVISQFIVDAGYVIFWCEGTI